MKKQFLKVSSLLVILLVLSLSLSSCQGDLLTKGKNQLALESKNMELESEVESLKAQLALYEKTEDKSTVMETSFVESEPSDTQVVEVTTGDTDIEYERMSPEEWLDRFKYEGNLEINGKKASEMSREELEALPPIVKEYTDANGVKRELGLNGAENLFEQLAFAAYLQHSLADFGGDPVNSKIMKPVQEDLLPGQYDIEGKSLVIHRDAETALRTVYEFDKEQSLKLNAWLLENLQNPVEPLANFSFDTELITADGESIFFTQADFLEPKDKQEAKLKKNDDEYFTIDLKADPAENLRKLLEEAGMNTLYDEAAFYEMYPEAPHPTSLKLTFVEKPSSEHAKISIRNFAEETLIYTNLYRLSAYNGEDWETILPVKAGDCFTMKEYKIAAGEERKFDINYADCYEELASGYYRISLNFIPDKAAAEDNSFSTSAQGEEYSLFFVIK